MVKSERRIVNSVVGVEVREKLDKKRKEAKLSIYGYFDVFLMMDWQGRNRWLSLLGF